MSDKLFTGPQVKQLQQGLYELNLCKQKIATAESAGLDVNEAKQECEFLEGLLSGLLEAYHVGNRKTKET